MEGRRSVGGKHIFVKNHQPGARFQHILSLVLANLDVDFRTCHWSLLILMQRFANLTFFMVLETSDRQKPCFQARRSARTLVLEGFQLARFLSFSIFHFGGPNGRPSIRNQCFQIRKNSLLETSFSRARRNFPKHNFALKTNEILTFPCFYLILL